MATKIQIRRLLDAERTGITFDAGMPVYTLDTRKLYLGDGVTAGGREACLLPEEVEALYTPLEAANYRFKNGTLQLRHPSENTWHDLTVTGSPGSEELDVGPADT